MAESNNELFNYVTSKLSSSPQYLYDDKFWNAKKPDPLIKLDYALLNNVTSYQPKAIHDKQLSILENININSYIGSLNLDKLNKMLFNENATIMTQDGSNQEVLLETVIKKIIGYVYLLRSSSKKSSGIDPVSMQRRYNNAAKAINQIHNIILQFGLDKQSGYTADTLQTLDSLLKKLESNDVGLSGYHLPKSFGTAEMRLILNNLNTIQGNLLEALGVEALSQWIPQDMNIKVINTGMIEAKSPQTGKSEQLIQDIMAVSISGANLSNINMDFTIDKKKYSLPLLDFLNKVNTYRGERFIVLTDQSYQILQDLSVLNLQAKSGRDQLIWNTNKKNKIALKDLLEPIDEWDNLTGMQIFQILEELNDVSMAKGIAWVNAKDDGTYNNIASYALSYNLGQLLNYGLSGGQNQIMLTRKGFRTFPQALEDLVGSTGYIKFSQAINIEDGMLDTKRNTTVTKI